MGGIKLVFSKQKLWYVLLIGVLVSSTWANLSVTTQEELVFGDEGYYASTSQGFAENLDVRYRTVFGETDLVGKEYHTREPMTFLMLGSFYMLFGEMGMKILIPMVSVVSALFLFLLVKKMHSVEAGVLSALLYLAVPAIVTHTVFVYVEHIALMFLIGSFYFLYSYIKDEDFLHLIFTGVLFGFSILTAQNVIIVPIIFAVVLLLYKVSWEGWFKEFGTLVLITLIMMAPWMAHNYRVGNGLGFDTHRVLEPLGLDLREPSQDYTEQLPGIETGGFPEDPRDVGGIHAQGYISFIEFAYTIPIFVLAMLGFSFYLVKKNKKYAIPLLWALVMFAVIYSLLWHRSFDMVSRNLLYITAPLAMAAWFASEKIYRYLNSFESTGKMLGIFFVLVLVGWSLFTVAAKAESLRPQKQFSEPFFEACDWVSENTQEDSVMHYVYRWRTLYHCQRHSIRNDFHGMEDAIVSADQNTYETYKAIGVDYVMLHSRLVDWNPGVQSYSFDFVQYIMFDPLYEQVYSYPDGCNIMDMQQDCVAVFEILDEEDVDEEAPDEQTITIDPEDLEGEEGDEEAQIELG